MIYLLTFLRTGLIWVARSGAVRWLVLVWGRVGGPILAFRVGRLLKTLARDKLGLSIFGTGLALNLWGLSKLSETFTSTGDQWLNQGTSGQVPTALLPLLGLIGYYFPIKGLMALAAVMLPAEVAARLWAWRMNRTVLRQYSTGGRGG